jgi:hypothetical protein
MSISITSTPNTDSTGNITVTTTPASSTLPSGSTVFKSKEFAIAVKTETTLADLTYTVTAGKSLYLSYFGCSLTASFPCAFRLKVNGATKLTQAISSDNSASFNIDKGVLIAVAGDVITVTYDPQMAKGVGFASFIGSEQ